MASVKNQLQEFFQKKGLPLPHYETERIAGEDHEPRFSSTVHLPHDVHITGDPCRKKVDAEKSAAQKALDSLERVLTSQIAKLTLEENPIELSSTHRVTLFIDLESIPQFIPYLAKQPIRGDFRVFGFVGQSCGLMNRKKEIEKAMSLTVVPSTQRDAVDSLIIWAMAIQWKLLDDMKEDKDDTFFVATKDHFGQAITETLQKMKLTELAIGEFHLVHCTSVEDFTQRLN